MRSRYYNALAAFAFAVTLCAAAPAPPAHAAGHDPHGEAKAVVYTCPMHPEVKSKKKGSCPKCKMDLRPQRAEAAGAEAGAAPSGSGVTAAHESHAASKMAIPDV